MGYKPDRRKRNPTKEFMRHALAQPRYLWVPRHKIILPMVPYWLCWLAIAFVPGITYFALTIPITFVSALVLTQWYPVWAAFGYAKKTFIGLHVLVHITAYFIGFACRGVLLELLLSWRIIYGY